VPNVACVTGLFICMLIFSLVFPQDYFQIHMLFSLIFSYIFCVVFCRSLFVPFLHLSLAIVLSVLVLSVLLRFTASDYQIGIFSDYLFC
jgi:hypothetical protein